MSTHAVPETLARLPRPWGGVTPAAVIQQGTLAALSDRFSVVVQDTATLWGQAQSVA